MNKRYCVIMLLLSCRICYSQNIVPNENFELHYGCPSGPDNIHNLDSLYYWVNPSTVATPDYFNECGTDQNFNVPNNIMGFQPALSGVAYCGVLAAVKLVIPGSRDYREYLSVPLNKPLIRDTCYYFQMYINLGDNSKYSTDDFGAYFSTTTISEVNNWDALPYIPQVSNTQGNFLNDTLNWVLISGYFRAFGGEIQLIIGNFKDDNNTTLIQMPWVVGQLPYAYYYVDSVSLIQVPNCNTRLSDFNANTFINLFPNPVNDLLIITNSKNELSEIILYNIVSYKINKKAFTISTSLNMQRLENGIYFYEVRNKNGLMRRGKVVKK